MGKRGPTPLGNDIELRTTITPEIDAALAQLVELSGGKSKATFVRKALLDMLTSIGLVYPEVTERLHPTRTAGRPIQRPASPRRRTS